MLGIFSGTVSIQSISYLFYFESWRVNEGKVKSRKHVKDESYVKGCISGQEGLTFSQRIISTFTHF